MTKEFSETVVYTQLDRAHLLLENSVGKKFQKPKLRIGNKYQGEFIEIKSLKDLATASQTLGAYDDTTNSIFVPDRALMKECDTERIIALLHEDVHTLIVQCNPQFTMESVKKLFQSKKRSTIEKGYIYIVFMEGLAEYLSHQACLQSGDPSLEKQAISEHDRYGDNWHGWISSREFALMSSMYKFDSNDWQKTLMRYLTREMEVGLNYYRYDLGYYFMSEIQPQQELIFRMIASPPSTIGHIIYPETYLQTLR